MKKRVLLFLLVTVFVSLRQTLKAQLRADQQSLYVKSGTQFCAEGLSFIPSSDFELKALTLTKVSSSIAWPQYNSITRMYRFTSPIAFRGTVALSFLNSELNGNNPSSLSFAYSNAAGSNSFKDYLLASGSISNAYDGYVSQYFSEVVSFSDLTAVSSSLATPPITLSGSTTFCKGEFVTLSTVSASGWQWFRNGTQIQGANKRELIVMDSGEYSVQTIAANGVATISDPVKISVTLPPVVQLSSDKGENLSLGDELQLKVSGIGSFNWEVTDGLVSGLATDSVIVVRPSKSTTYKVSVSNGTGCNVIKTMAINVLKDYKSLIPNNMVTPNGDAVNDVWIVKNLDMYPNNEVKIFDRAGRLVYTKNSYDNSWDATFNGAPVPEDTYYYVLSVDSGNKKFTGFISVVRE